MKKIIALLALFISAFANAQFGQQQDTSEVTITLKAKHHAYIIAFMGDRGQSDRIRYVNQVARQLKDTANKDQAITVTVSESLLKRLYITIGSQPERLTSTINGEIKAALLPQIHNNQSLMKFLLEAEEASDSETDRMVKSGFAFIQSIKD